jgi:hypothetical protein
MFGQMTRRAGVSTLRAAQRGLRAAHFIGNLIAYPAHENYRSTVRMKTGAFR